MDNATMTLTAATASTQAGLDIGMILAVFLPFIAFLLLVYWGFNKKERKQRVIELSYNLIALELLLFVLLPLCDQPIACGLWALIPIAMFSVLIFFMYHRNKKEKEYKERVAKALADGHLELSGVLQGKLEEEIRKATYKESKEKKKTKKVLSTKKVEKKEEIKTGGSISVGGSAQVKASLQEEEQPEHKKIGQIVKRVVDKKKAPKKKAKKK